MSSFASCGSAFEKNYEHEIRSLFPAASKYTSSTARLFRRTVDRCRGGNEQFERVAEKRLINYGEWIATKNRARALIAQISACLPEQVHLCGTRRTGSLRSPTAYWKTGDNIVTLRTSFRRIFTRGGWCATASASSFACPPNKTCRNDEDELIE